MVPPHSFFRSNLRKFLLTASLLFLILSISTQERVDPQGQGRSSFMHKELSKKGEGKEMPMVNSMIGSRPPRCEKICLKCGHCEAVQIPVTPQAKRAAVDSLTTKNARGDDKSNYKPMNWMCKCGDFIFNPLRE